MVVHLSLFGGILSDGFPKWWNLLDQDIYGACQDSLSYERLFTGGKTVTTWNSDVQNHPFGEAIAPGKPTWMILNGISILGKHLSVSYLLGDK